MPAPPPESEPAMVTAIAVMARSDVWREFSACRPRAGGDDNEQLGGASFFSSLAPPLGERSVHDPPPPARGVGRVLRARERRDNTNAARARLDGRPPVPP